MNKGFSAFSQTSGEASTLQKTGFYSAVLLAILAFVTFGIAILTPPISGPFSTGSSVSYPYTDIASRFPRDYYWMIPAMLLMFVFVVFMACLDQTKQRLNSRVALIFACISASILTVTYFVQVSVIQPSVLGGEHDGIALLTQYNPHGLFIAAEEIGYLFMTVALLFLAPVFSKKERVQYAIRIIAIVGFALTVLSFVGISVAFGVQRGYLFEVAIITIAFFELILISILTAVLFRRSTLAAR